MHRHIKKWLKSKPGKITIRDACVNTHFESFPVKTRKNWEAFNQRPASMDIQNPYNKRHFVRNIKVFLIALLMLPITLKTKTRMWSVARILNYIRLCNLKATFGVKSGGLITEILASRKRDLYGFSICSVISLKIIPHPKGGRGSRVSPPPRTASFRLSHEHRDPF